MKAFPGMDLNMDKVIDGHEFEYVPHLGMDLRDYFAAKALQVFLNEGGFNQPEAGAKLAYEYADAMIKARNGNN